MRRLLLAAAALFALAQGCSFTTASGFVECQSDVDCGNAAACSSGYCLPMPAGCRRDESPAFATADRIPLLALLALTDNGARDVSEEQGLNAMRLAVSEANTGKGIKNRLFGLFVCDTGAPDAGFDEQLEWMVLNARVPAALVSGSGDTLGAAKNAVRLDAGTLLISATATSPALISTFQVEGNVWRVPPPDTLQARVLGELFKQDYPDAGGTRVGVLHLTGVYGDGFGLPLAETLSALGYQVTRRPFTRNDVTSQTTAINELSNDQPAATIVIAFPPDVKTLIGLARARPTLQRTAGHRWYLTDACKDPASLTGTLPDLDGAFGTAAAQGAGGAFTSFRDGFRTRYLIDPNSLSYTSHSYDATWVVMLAAAAASQGGGAVTGPALGASVAKLVAPGQAPLPLRPDKWTEASDLLSSGSAINVEGASGALDFDPLTGAPAAPYEVWQVRDGGIAFVRQVNP